MAMSIKKLLLVASDWWYGFSAISFQSNIDRSLHPQHQEITHFYQLAMLLFGEMALWRLQFDRMDNTEVHSITRLVIVPLIDK